MKAVSRVLLCCAALLLAGRLLDGAGPGGGSGPSRSTPPDAKVIFEAMSDEMARAMEGLRVKGQPPPYYMACTIDDMTTERLRASLGALVEESSARTRILRVEVRVGDYGFDSSRFVSYDQASGGLMSSYASASGMITTLDDDYDALRSQIWLMADAAYKRALDSFSRKEALRESRSEPDEVPDFWPAPPVVTMVEQSGPPSRMEPWREMVTSVSATFRQAAFVRSDALLTCRHGTRYYTNSEGTRAMVPSSSAVLVVRAETQADEGMKLRDEVTVVEESLEDFPAPPVLERQAAAMAARLAALRHAPVADDYTGPVLVEGQASGQLIAQALVPLFLAARPPESDVPRGDVVDAHVTPLLARIGSRVLPTPFSVSDRPSLRFHEGRRVAGAYTVDEEGVAAKDVELVKDGRLLTLLTSRTPLEGLSGSNGHCRGGGAQAGVFTLWSRDAVPAAELKARYLSRLREEGRPFGFIVRRVRPEVATRLDESQADEMAAVASLLAGARSRSGPAITEIVQVWQDGTERPVRGVTLGEVSRATFRDLLDASRELRLQNVRTATSGLGAAAAFHPGPGEEVTVSVIAPDLVFEELEIRKARETFERPPVVPPPLAAATGSKPSSRRAPSPPYP